jgi:hypothetical protein
MKDRERVCSYENLPLVLNVADIQRITGIPSWGPRKIENFVGRGGAAERASFRVYAETNDTQLATTRAPTSWYISGASPP